jgi:hypothetical protein
MDDKKVVFDGIKENPNQSEHQKELEHYVALFRVAVRAQMALAKEYMAYRSNVLEAKTAPKKELYEKKCAKVKAEFDEVSEKAMALADLLASKGIDVDSIVDKMITEHAQDQEQSAKDEELVGEIAEVQVDEIPKDTE